MYLSSGPGLVRDSVVALLPVHYGDLHPGHGAPDGARAQVSVLHHSARAARLCQTVALRNARRRVNDTSQAA